MKSSVKIGLVIVLCLIGLISAAVIYAIVFKSGPAGGDPRASVKLGKTETRSNLSTASTIGSPGNAGFSSRHVLLYSDNPHPFNRRIETLLAQRLKDCPFIERLDLTNGAFFQTNGAAAPDLFLNVHLVEIKQGGVLSSTLKATVAASLGSALWDSSYYSRDDSTPPLVDFSWKARVESESVFTGVRTDRYADAAHEIAGSFAKAITNEIQELAGKYVMLPELPPDFYGPYQPVADFDFLKEVQGRRVGSYCGLFTHNQTFWQFQTASNPAPQLRRVLARLETAGWKISEAHLTNTATPSVRCRQGGAELEIFRLQANRLGFSPEPSGETAWDFAVHYRQPFTRSEREAALERLFAQDNAVEMLLPFQNSLSAEQRSRFFALAEKSPATSPRLCLQLAQFCLNRKETNAAISHLARAKALAETVKDASTFDSDIESAAKKISPKQKLKLEVTPEVCRELGFLELTNAAATIEQTRPLGRPLVFFIAGKGGVKVWSLTIGPARNNSYPWTLVQAEAGSRSCSWGGFGLSSRGDWRQAYSFERKTLNVIAVPLSDKKQVAFTVQIGG